MTQCVTTLLAAALAAAAFVSAARAESPEEEIRRAIVQLGDDDPTRRDQAQEWLREIGPEAALAWSPEKDGADPERRRRMSELLQEWNFVRAAQAAEPSSPVRIVPWDGVEGLGARALFEVQDDRLAALVAGAPPAARRGDVVVLVTRADLNVSAEAVEAALEENAEFTIHYLAELNGDLPPGVRKAILARMREPAFLSHDNAARLLWRCGDREPLLAMARGRRWPVADRGFDECSTDSEVCEALALAYVGSPDEGLLAPRFPARRHADRYLEEARPDLLARLPREDSEPRLRKLLAHREPQTRFRAAFRLALAGIESEPLALFADPKSWGTEWNPAEFALVSPMLPGKLVEERLRELSDNPLLSDQARDAALLGLTARKRERDITFVYTRLKDLPPGRQPPIAVGLARLGSAAGVGVLIPVLQGLDYAARRDANEALKTITGQDFGYDPRGTLPERCRAARRWATWWRENRTSFHPDVK